MIFYYGATKLISNHSVATMIRKKIHEDLGLYDKSFLILADSKFIIEAYQNNFVFQYHTFVSGYVGSDGISYKRKVAAKLEQYRILHELNFSKILNIFILTLRLLKA